MTSSCFIITSLSSERSGRIQTFRSWKWVKLVWTLTCKSILLSTYPGRAEFYGNSIFNIQETVFHGGCNISHSHQNYLNIPPVHILADLSYCLLEKQSEISKGCFTPQIPTKARPGLASTTGQELKLGPPLLKAGVQPVHPHLQSPKTGTAPKLGLEQSSESHRGTPIGSCGHSKQAAAPFSLFFFFFFSM